MIYNLLLESTVPFLLAVRLHMCIYICIIIVTNYQQHKVHYGKKVGECKLLLCSYLESGYFIWSYPSQLQWYRTMFSCVSPASPFASRSTFLSGVGKRILKKGISLLRCNTKLNKSYATKWQDTDSLTWI